MSAPYSSGHLREVRILSATGACFSAWPTGSRSVVPGDPVQASLFQRLTVESISDQHRRPQFESVWRLGQSSKRVHDGEANRIVFIPSSFSRERQPKSFVFRFESSLGKAEEHRTFWMSRGDWGRKKSKCIRWEPMCYGKWIAVGEKSGCTIFSRMLKCNPFFIGTQSAPVYGRASATA